MIPLWEGGLLAAAGLGLGYLLGRGSRRGAVPREDLRADAPLDTASRALPDPGLSWLARAHQAKGAWAVEAQADATLALARSPEAETLPGDVRETLERKLRHMAAQGGEGTERTDAGTLVYSAKPGVLGALLFGAAEAPDIDRGRADLRTLVEVLHYQRILLPTREAKSPVESLETVCHGLALQLERITGTGVLVVINLNGGAQVVAISPRVDTRRQGTWAEPDSPVMPVLRGETESTLTPFDPLGSAINDRRRQPTSYITGIGPDAERLGAVVLTPASSRAVEGKILADIQEAIAGMQTAISNARMVHELHQRAATDPLTGLKNRRGLEAEMARIGGEMGTLIYADLDRFKALNDTLGHPAGDAALVHFAGLIREHVRATDTAARIGGEEFAIWLPEGGIKIGQQIAERIRESLGTRIFQWQGTHWPLSASFGVAGCPETTRSRKNLPAQADAALYQAKHGGRNRVVVARSSS